MAKLLKIIFIIVLCIAASCRTPNDYRTPNDDFNEWETGWRDYIATRDTIPVDSNINFFAVLNPYLSRYDTLACYADRISISCNITDNFAEFVFEDKKIVFVSDSSIIVKEWQ